MALMANSRPRATQEGRSKLTPKWRKRGRENQAASPTSAKLTMPKHSAAM